MMIKYETDSRLVKKGQTFVALKGEQVDGHDFINQAIQAGATKVVGSRSLKLRVPYEKVKDPRAYLINHISDEYQAEFQDMDFIGITGTNGKTTVCYLIYQILKALSFKVAYIGTLGYQYQTITKTLDNTTPDILVLYNLILEAKSQGCRIIVLEVSSHALELKRIQGLHFKIAGFTNLTQDHLDFHQNMDNYLKAKLKILKYLAPDGIFITNNDDEFGKCFKTKRFKTLTYGRKSSDYLIKQVQTDLMATTINFEYQNQSYQVNTKLTGEFNVSNYMLALSVVHNYGITISKIIKISPKLKAPKGRSETYQVKGGFAVVDYAHTPDAVAKIINSFQKYKTAKLYTIVGCGGNRDKTKRPIMGQIASDLSDYCIFTSDNPRFEDPKSILDDITRGLKRTNYEVIEDRPQAIKRGMSLLKKNDILLVLGKGHENYQIIGSQKIHCDDVEEILKFNR